MNITGSNGMKCALKLKMLTFTATLALLTNQFMGL